MSMPSRTTPWSLAVSPERSASPDDVVVAVDQALLTGFESGPVSSTGGPRKWIRGAVHDRDGVLVPASQRHWAGDTNAPLAVDPERVAVPRRGRRLEGAWLYVGHWPQQFGHFVIETLSNLWPDPAGLDVVGLVGHRRFRGDAGAQPRPRAKDVALDPWKRDFLELAGYGDLPHVQVNAAPAHVERLHVPSHPVVLKSWARPAAVSLWQRVASRAGLGGGPARVFLSRRLWHEAKWDRPNRVRTSAAWETWVEQQFRDHGFEIVHPETLSVAEQVALVRDAEVVAGPSGSALHLSAFSPAGTRVIEVGDSRSPTSAMLTQRMIDAACGHRTAFCPYEDEEEARRVLRSC